MKKIGNPDTFETIRFAQNKTPQESVRNFVSMG